MAAVGALSVTEGKARARRSAASASFTPGYYKALSFVGCNPEAEPECSPTDLSLRLPSQSTGPEQLPPDCFLVERVVATRKHKVTS